MNILTQMGCKHYYTACVGTTEIADSTSLVGALNALNMKGEEVGIIYKRTEDELGYKNLTVYTVCYGKVLEYAPEDLLNGNLENGKEVRV